MKATTVMGTALGLTLLITGCGDRPATLEKSPLGSWEIVGHRIPGVAAMTDEEARKWHGRKLVLSEQAAVFEADSCLRPQYRTRQVAADSLATVGFRVAPGSLGPGIPPGGATEITEVTCQGETWYSAGALLLWTSPTTALTPWEGVFFELEKKR